MGIAGLARRLEPYCARFTAAELSGYKAIVDGPSLAYHAQKLALTDGDNQSRIPSYADINRQALRWLKALEDNNIKVSAILFDGVLPATKIEERVSRLNKSNQRVRLFRIQYPNVACPDPTPLGSISYSLLAPALREALIDSEYAAVTRIVPGEADDFCAPCANDTPRSIIFSSDSDLLLYNYHKDCRIVFFEHVELGPEPHFKGHSPVQLSQSLGLTRLAPLAYCLTLDYHQTFNALLESAKSVDTRSNSYIEFSSRYGGAEEHDPDARPHLPPSSTLPQYLDVRVSEFIAQVDDGVTVPVTYLPLLVEDPNAASAWNMGHDIRLLAYSLFATMRPSPFAFFGFGENYRQTVEEYRRKAQAVTKHKLHLHKPAELGTAAAEMASNLSIWSQWMMDRKVPQDMMWPLIAANLVLLELPSAPKISFFIRVLIGDFDSTWEFIHLSARLHAALYSLRILGQCVDVWLSAHQHSLAEPRQHMDTLSRHLVDMPSIAELFLVPGQERKPQVDSELLKELLEEMYTSALIEIPSEQLSNKKAKRQQREAERKERRQREEEGQRSFNVFDLLNRE